MYYIAQISQVTHQIAQISQTLFIALHINYLCTVDRKVGGAFVSPPSDLTEYRPRAADEKDRETTAERRGYKYG